MNKIGGKQNNMNGYNGSISGMINNFGWNGSVFVSGQQGKLTYSANVTHNHSQTGKMELTTERIASDGSKMNSFQTSKTKVPFNMANFSLG